MPDSARSASAPSAFTRSTQRQLTALRVTAYSLAICFMIVMVLRGVWTTRDQLEAETDRAIRSAGAAMTGLIATGAAPGSGGNAILQALAPPHVTLRMESAPDGKPEGSTSDVRTRPIGKQWQLVATVDHQGILFEAIAVNGPYILFVLALGLPTVAIFLYMGWLVNRPALQLLAFAQASGDAISVPPDLPRIWQSVLERLRSFASSSGKCRRFSTTRRSG